MSAAGKNLEAIDGALAQHAERCGDDVRAIEMSPFEVERLGWEDYRGIPIRGNEKIGTGRFRLVCDGGAGKAPEREREAVTA